MDLTEKVAQLFLVGFDGTDPSTAARELVADYGVGGVVYFRRNVERPPQVADLSAQLQALAAEAGRPPLFVAIDQEGGIVSRLPWDTRLPGQMAVGATREDELARRSGSAVGRELRTLGINLNLAPVLDVNNDPDNPVIGVRSFGEEPELVSDLGAAVAAGLQEQGVLACGKHFPGHGDTAVDSHLDLPVIDHDRERLDRVELRPFRAAIDAGIDAIMTTHVAFPTITDEPECPATLSERVLAGLLREELGYDGLVVTDCLEMDAIADGVETVEGAVQAIEAGCDLVTISHTPERQRGAIEAVVEAVESGRIDEARIGRSVRRILRTKEVRGVREHDPDLYGWETVGEGWQASTEACRDVGRQVAEASVTLVRDRDAALPLSTDEGIHVWSFPAGRGSEVEDGGADAGAFVEGLRSVGFDVEVRMLDPDTPIGDVPEEPVVVPTRNAASNPGQARVVSELDDAGARLVVLAVRNPYDLRAFPDVSTYLTTYDDAPVSLVVASEVVAGERDARGTLPVTIPDA
jgi:beta-N-acetylhexosaminidase